MTTAPLSGDELSPNELKLIADAAQYVENPSLLTKMANDLVQGTYRESARRCKQEKPR